MLGCISRSNFELGKNTVIDEELQTTAKSSKILQAHKPKFQKKSANSSWVEMAEKRPKNLLSKSNFVSVNYF